MVLLDDVQLRELYTIIMMALDHNPSEIEFRDKMMPAKVLIGNVNWAKWMLFLQTITTKGERPGYMNFLIEDWITNWYITDFIDKKILIARINI